MAQVQEPTTKPDASLLKHCKASDLSSVKRSIEGHYADLLADVQFFANHHRQAGNLQQATNLEEALAGLRNWRHQISENLG